MIESPNQDWSRSVVRLGLSTLVICLIAFWFWAFFLAPSGNPDRIEDRVWASNAENLCAEFRLTIQDLPLASTATTPNARANMIDEITVLVGSLVNSLESLCGGTEDDRFLIESWIYDWRIYIQDRNNYAEELRTEGDVAPLLTSLPSGSGSHLDRQNGFARVNDLDSCLDPGDF